jgi:ribosomal protein S18 acetylase RimI-like enzyme
MYPKIIIREACNADREGYEAVSHCAIQILRKTYRPKRGVTSAPAIGNDLKRLVALINEKIVGTVRYSIDENRLHLLGLMVHPDFHHQGIAKELVRYLTERAEDQNIKILSLYTIKETGNVNIFEKMGFKVVRMESADIWAESDVFNCLTDVYMQKEV